MMQNLEPVRQENVELTSGVLAERARVNREEMLSDQYSKLEEHGRVDLLRKAAGEDVEVEYGHKFWDSDIAKWLEALGYSLARYPNPELEQKADAIVDLYERAQEEDGYLNSYFSVFEPDAKWNNLRDEHELYCIGHLIEAAISYYEGTGKRKLLDIMCSVVDHVDSKFGPEEDKLPGYPGHQELELALVKLYKVTGEKRHLNLAKFMVDERAQQPHYFELEAERRGASHPGRIFEYFQAHQPVREQKEAVGHAVRATYMYSGMADVANQTDDADLLQSCKDLWHNVTRKNMYITGGIGARHEGEAFGEDYELPNATAYAETCAAIALVFYAHRMLQIEAKSDYADVLERALFNGVFPGVGLEGRTYFYVNPLSYDGKREFDHGGNQRQEWFGCACCPPNVARLFAKLGQYLYSTGDDGLYVHLYSGSETKLEVCGKEMTVTQKTNYPWDGKIDITIRGTEPGRVPVRLRIPGWCSDYELKVNGESVEAECSDGYLVLDRDWTGEDNLQLNLKMPVKQVVADPKVESVRGCAALQRGPIVYCVEQVDNDASVSSLALLENAELNADYHPELLGGCCVIEGSAEAVDHPEEESLYVEVSKVKSEPVNMKAIPYALWANRGNHPMTIWMQRRGN